MANPTPLLPKLIMPPEKKAIRSENRDNSTKIGVIVMIRLWIQTSLRYLSHFKAYPNGWQDDYRDHSVASGGRILCSAN